jgi:sulfite dehydrogenase (quinone) subunit SoeC
LHPAYSVIVFSTLSGAGYGLWALAALAGAAHGPASSFAFGGLVMAIGFGLVTIGLLASTLHLGHPERAWRAMSQWRSSWLSREGVMALVTYAPAMIFGWLWLDPASTPHAIRAAGLVLAAMCAFTVACTAMIYASLPTVRQWRQPLVLPVYLVMAVATGAALLLAIATPFGRGAAVLAGIAIIALLVAVALKLWYWRAIDTASRDLTIAMATGLPEPVRQWEQAHTARNFVMQEMGYHVGRRHALRLRTIAVALLGLAAILALPAMLLGTAGLSAVAAVLSAGAALAGTLVERWLFFAEAEHVSSLYYGSARA